MFIKYLALLVIVLTFVIQNDTVYAMPCLAAMGYMASTVGKVALLLGKGALGFLNAIVPRPFTGAGYETNTLSGHGQGNRLNHVTGYSPAQGSSSSVSISISGVGSGGSSSYGSSGYSNAASGTGPSGTSGSNSGGGTSGTSGTYSVGGDRDVSYDYGVLMEYLDEHVRKPYKRPVRRPVKLIKRPILKPIVGPGRRPTKLHAETPDDYKILNDVSNENC